MSAASPFDPCPTCGNQPAGLSINVAPIHQALWSVGAERSAIETAYRMHPTVPRGLMREIVRYVRANPAPSPTNREGERR